MSGRAPFSHLIYPVPMAGGLGIHLTFDLGGQARFGPDVQWIDRLDYEVDPSRAGAFYEAIRGLLARPSRWRADARLCRYQARISGPGESPGDFVIQGPEETGHSRYIALYGIDSPGLTASLAIGEYIADLAS